MLSAGAAIGLVRGQDNKPDFSGRWELSLPRSQAPSELPFITQDVKQSATVLSWTTLYRRPEEKNRVPSYLMGLADRSGFLDITGQETVGRNGSMELRSRSVWEGARLVTNWSLRQPGRSVTVKWERWLSSDGRTQFISIDFRSNRAAHARLVFEKR
jgi:hypothetical protein